ncbi:hypothetical protein GJAV_G00049160 [Gymnothorax javanicus]|nr:hypothetical protein GJAV_G00049160 [Gymnothorax javanicus]
MDARLHLCLLALLGQLGGAPACRVGTREECEVAPFVPGHNLAGEGFDIVKLQRKTAFVIDLQTFLTANKTCTLCENKVNGDELQKLPVSVLDWRSFTHCKRELSSSLHETVSSVARSPIKFIENDWTEGLDIQDTEDWILGGSRAPAVEFATSAFAIDKSVFAAHQLSCSHYRYRVSDRPPLSLEFRQQLGSLPQEYNRSTQYLYRRFINTYGTHYIQQVTLGGRFTRLTAIRTCLATVNHHLPSKIKDCLTAGLSVGLGFQDRSATSNQCKSLLENQDVQTGSQLHYLNHKTEVIGGNDWLGEVSLNKDDSAAFQSWLTSLKDAPQVLSYSLFPLHQLIPNPGIRENVKTAVQWYLVENAVEKDGPAEQCFGQPNLSHDCCPLEPMRGRLQVKVIRAWGLYGDTTSSTDGYVKVRYWHHFHQTHCIDGDDNPQWDLDYDLGHVEASHELTFEVWDADTQYDDLLGTCSTKLHEGTHIGSCSLKEGGGLVYAYRLTCDPQLGGSQCAKYKPAPSDRSQYNSENLLRLFLLLHHLTSDEAK